MSTTPKKSRLAQAAADTARIDLAKCYQCGKCTAGCPMVRFMDLSPNQVMLLARSLAPEDEERLLSCEAPWFCAGCLTCTQRCPQGLDPAAVMDALRGLAYSLGRVPRGARKVLAFHEAFLRTVESDGRMNEVPLVARYKPASGDFFSDMELALFMLGKGKLPLLPHRIKGRAEVKRIFAAARRKKG